MSNIEPHYDTFNLWHKERLAIRQIRALRRGLKLDTKQIRDIFLKENQDIPQKIKDLLCEAEGGDMPQHRLFGFIDILGFKELLLGDQFEQLESVFEDIADEIYQHRRRAKLIVPEDLFPTISNFSDTVFLHVRYPAGGACPNLGRLSWNIFLGACRAICRGAIRQGVPVRGGISLGSLASNSIESLVPASVNRWGVPMLMGQIAEEYAMFYGRPIAPSDETDDARILPAQPVSFLYGRALHGAYMAQEGLPGIGVFIDPSMHTSEFLDTMQSDDLVKCEIAQETRYALNWCKGMGEDFRDYILRLAEDMSSHENPKVAQKWSWFHKFMNSTAYL